jgi:hypothetical protein
MSVPKRQILNPKAKWSKQKVRIYDALRLIPVIIKQTVDSGHDITFRIVCFVFFVFFINIRLFDILVLIICDIIPLIPDLQSKDNTLYKTLLLL